MHLKIFFVLCLSIAHTACCPTGCVCKVPNVGTNAYHVKCGNLGLSDVGQDIPHQTTDLAFPGNQLKTLRPESFSKLKYLKMLYLEKNQFSQIDEQTVETLKSLRRLRGIELAENAWDCTCTPAMRQFVEWLESVRGPVPIKSGKKWIAMVNGYNAKCASPPSLQNKRLDRLTVEDVCPT